jgi:hypothetical protein
MVLKQRSTTRAPRYPSTECCLADMAVVVDDERMHIDPTPARRYQLHTVRSPDRLGDIAQVAQCGQDLTFERAVDVDVDVSVRSAGPRTILLRRVARSAPAGGI